VILLDDEFTGRLEPEIGLAAVRVLEAAGERVSLPRRPVASGRSLISRGLVDAARRELGDLLDTLEPDLRAGLTVVGLEPSCLLTLRDELAALFPEDPRVELLAARSQLLDEYMSSRLDRVRWKADPVSVLVHLHCHRQALAGPDALRGVLDALPGVEARILDAGCCGMAGSFGYDHHHYDLSMAIGERVLFPAVRAANPATLLVIEGTSCRHQVLDGTGRRGLHPAELLAMRLRDA
jgi:Fe-S oxidoreductase